VIGSASDDAAQGQEKLRLAMAMEGKLQALGNQVRADGNNCARDVVGLEILAVVRGKILILESIKRHGG
jgi:hypothetical protein